VLGSEVERRGNEKHEAPDQPVDCDLMIGYGVWRESRKLPSISYFLPGGKKHKYTFAVKGGATWFGSREKCQRPGFVEGQGKSNFQLPVGGRNPAVGRCGWGLKGLASLASLVSSNVAQLIGQRCPVLPLGHPVFHVSFDSPVVCLSTATRKVSQILCLLLLLFSRQWAMP